MPPQPRSHTALLAPCAFLFLFLFSSCSLVTPGLPEKPATSGTVHGSAALQKAIQSLIQNITASTVGIKVVSLEDKKTIYALNSARLFHPASTLKLFTAAAALHSLGPEYQFTTSLKLAPLAIVNGTIHGDIYLVGSGDPSLRTEDLAIFASRLKDAGIHTITGNILCDDSLLDTLRYGKGWMWDDQPYKDFAPISALSVNRSTIDIVVSPHTTAGPAPQAATVPETRFVTLINRSTTVDAANSSSSEPDAPGSRGNSQPLSVLRRWQENENIFDITGTLPSANQPVTFTQNIVHPTLYAGTLFLEACQKAGIQVAGTVQRGQAPEDLLPFCVHRSPPARELIAAMNKGSHNLDAELFLKVVGARTKGAPGTTENGVEAIGDLLTQWQIEPNLSRFADGSGVSRYNLVSPDTLTLLLEKTRKAPFFGDFLNSLSIAGVDGYLRDRMRNGAARNKVFAKTGSMSGVSALTGYAESEDGELLAFTIMMEHFLDAPQSYLDIQDQICDLLCRYRDEK